MTLPTKVSVFSPDVGDVELTADQIAAILGAAAEGITFGALVASSLAASGAVSGASVASTGDISATKTLSTTNPATERLIYGKMNLTYQGNVTIGSGGSVAGVRGEVSGASGAKLMDGFYYGAQGKFTLGGSEIDETSASRYCGVIAQLDVSAGTMTGGQLSALWADMGASAAGAFAPETNVIRATNTTAQAVNAILYGYGKATYGFDLSDNGGGWLSTTGSIGTTAAKGWIKVNLNGAVRYIGVSDSVS